MNIVIKSTHPEKRNLLFLGGIGGWWDVTTKIQKRKY